MKKLLRLTFVVLLLVSTGNYAWEQDSNQKDRDLPVMTRNMDAGSDFGYILAAAMNPNSTQVDILGAITKTFLEMHMSNYASRPGLNCS